MRYSWLPALVAAALLLSTVAGRAAAEPLRELDIQGHRGCRGLMPENSLPAFRKALELGVTTLELDVQATADRVLVVSHDARLDAKRCVRADGTRVAATPFRRLKWEALADIDCGQNGQRGFPRQEAAPAPIPRLEEILALASDASYPVRLSIEVKLQDSKSLSPRELAELLVAAVREHGLIDRTTVQSFSPEVLIAVRAIEPELSRSMLVRDRGRYESLLDQTGADILSPKFTRLRKDDVRRVQQRGVAVIPWTVNDHEAIRQMIDWGVDGIISDYPDRVIEILRAR